LEREWLHTPISQKGFIPMSIAGSGLVSGNGLTKKQEFILKTIDKKLLKS
jgi:hypothetical protein